jgi:hypothetical protein
MPLAMAWTVDSDEDSGRHEAGICGRVEKQTCHERLHSKAAGFSMSFGPPIAAAPASVTVLQLA